MGEQIDTRSGNLNYTYPLVSAQGRGSTIPIVLSYNSQNWRLDPSGYVWDLDDSRNAGFGWTFQIGSVLPYYNDTTNTTDHYEYQDTTGAIYRLDQNNGGVWSSKQGVYVWYDSNANVLHFRDGSFWYMGSVAASAERDAGTYYPTVIEDSNGNQITIAYAAGQSSIWSNTSSRFTSITDARGAAYSFTYYCTPSGWMLGGVTNSLSSGESFSLNYNQVFLTSPFSPGTPSINTMALASITNNNTNLTTSFTYDPNSGELTQATFPYGGHIRWTYANEAYSQSTVRTVQNRYLYWDSTIGERAFSLALTADGSNAMTSIASISDSNANATKTWSFDTNADATQTLVTTYKKQNTTSGSVLRQLNYTWTQDSTGNNYISRTQEISDPSQSYAVTKQTDQTLDQYGNVTQSKLYNYSNLTTPTKTYTNTYLTGSNYSSRYIFNRPLTSTVTDGTNTLTLASNTYDVGSLADAPGITQHDANYNTSFTYRGSVTSSTAFAQTQNQQLDITGTVVETDDGNTNHALSIMSTSNYSVPWTITTASALKTTLAWSSFLAPGGATGPNGDSSTINYDASTARPSSTISPYGATTTYAYSNTAPQITATVNGRWTSTYLDGLGRTNRVATGYSSTTTSYVDTVYDTCGCTPTGKPYKTSLPYAPGATPAWNVNTYDAIGRTLTSVAPDGASTITYSNAGNTVTVTDPAGKWKQYTTDVFGQLVQVTEASPNPRTEPNHVTTYA
jgi:YD repeat-containing protein